MLSITMLAAQNDCGVKASFTPGNDSTFNSSGYLQLFTFTSTSTNADSLRWFHNGGYDPSGKQAYTRDLGRIGLHKITLVAIKGNCTDTAIAYFLNTGNKPLSTDPISRRFGFEGSIFETPTAFATLKDGSHIIGGQKTRFYGIDGEKALLIKLSADGCVQWSQQFDGISPGIVGVHALKDSGFLVGLSNYNTTALIRYDKNGNITWNINYLLNGIPFSFEIFHELEDGSIIASGAPSFSGFTVARISAAGNVIWSKHYERKDNDFSAARGIVEINDKIYVSGYANNPNNEDPFNGEYNKDGFLICINKNSGQTIWTKSYGAPGTDFFQDIYRFGNNLLVNNIRGKLLGGSFAMQTFAFIDTTGNLLKASRIINNVSPYSPNPTLGFPFTSRVFPIGNDQLYLAQCGTEYLSLQPGFSYHSTWLKIDTSNNIHWAKITTNRYRIDFTDFGKDKSLATVGFDFGYLLYSDDFRQHLAFNKSDSSGDGLITSCRFGNDAINIVPDTIAQTLFAWTYDTASTLMPSPSVTNPRYIPVWTRVSCPDYVDSCSYLKIEGRKRLCNLNKIYEYKVHKSRVCTTPITWEIPSGVQIISKTDTLLRVKFPSLGRYAITVTMKAECSWQKDSIVIIAESSNESLALGPDTIICPNTSIQLRAGKKFLTYKWQDGSTDSNFVATQAGEYWVEVMDSCDNIIRDTIIITEATNLTVNAGPDRQKCNADTIHLQAPAGYLSYQWSNNYNINSTTSPSVIVNPLTDTAYYLKAEKMPGCFAYDTIRIKVYTSRIVNIGNDTSICAGDSITFDAGGGFTDYRWSNGSTTRQIVAKTFGMYSVVATIAEGCKSFDTASIVNVFTLPVVSLDEDVSICYGETKVLNAGNFFSYLWNTGSVSQTITISDIGKYSVKVKDANGCSGSDSVEITRIDPSPANFLPVDTAICLYGKFDLKPATGFSKYTWSTGGTFQSIQITKPGIYWLDVKDANECIGRDSILITLKDCLNGFYVPTGFTPNNDLHNDTFKPMLFGNVKKYRFVIFNRWGEVVFETTDISKGWDGKLTGRSVSTDVFVWMCTYQFEGEKEKIEKGSVVLVK